MGHLILWKKEEGRSALGFHKSSFCHLESVRPSCEQNGKISAIGAVRAEPASVTTSPLKQKSFAYKPSSSLLITKPKGIEGSFIIHKGKFVCLKSQNKPRLRKYSLGFFPPTILYLQHQSIQVFLSVRQGQRKSRGRRLWKMQGAQNLPDVEKLFTKGSASATYNISHFSGNILVKGGQAVQHSVTVKMES